MNKALVFAGLPHTGKSTYLGLLNLALTKHQRVKLQLGSYKDDREYLNDLSKTLFDCEEPERTEVGQRRGLALSLKLEGESHWIEIPDLSGEVWEDVLSDRSLPPDVERAVVSASGICIFVHAGEFKIDPTLAQVANDMTKLGIPPGGDNNAFASPTPIGQVALIDLLQVLGEQFAPRGEGRRVSILLSAFDTAGAKSPEEWVEQCAPLLNQYLRSNPNRPPVRLYGLSAQGGDYQNPDSREKLKAQDPLERSYMIGQDAAPCELDEPIRWALGLD